VRVGQRILAALHSLFRRPGPSGFLVRRPASRKESSSRSLPHRPPPAHYTGRTLECNPVSLFNRPRHRIYPPSPRQVRTRSHPILASATPLFSGVLCALPGKRLCKHSFSPFISKPAAFFNNSNCPPAQARKSPRPPNPITRRAPSFNHAEIFSHQMPTLSKHSSNCRFLPSINTTSLHGFSPVFGNKPVSSPGKSFHLPPIFNSITIPPSVSQLSSSGFPLTFTHNTSFGMCSPGLHHAASAMQPSFVNQQTNQSQLRVTPRSRVVTRRSPTGTLGPTLFTQISTTVDPQLRIRSTRRRSP